MQFFLVLLGVSAAAASTIHYAPLLVARGRALGGRSEGPTNQYSEQHTKSPFYSYGYSGRTSATAEYSTLDGASKGVYSYIDSNGKLQTVEYEAGREQGFQATATNLPKPPADSRLAPRPVTDTPEVQMAKQAHFAAYRKAELQAALAPETTDDTAHPNGRERTPTIHGFLDDEALARLQSNNDDERDNNFRRTDQLMVDGRLPNSNRQMASYTINGVTDPDGRPQQTGSEGYIESTTAMDFPPRASIEAIRVPVNAYYSLLAPNTRYSVVTPTILSTIPRAEALKLGNKLPISFSTTFVSQRLNTKAT